MHDSPIRFSQHIRGHHIIFGQNQPNRIHCDDIFSILFLKIWKMNWRHLAPFHATYFHLGGSNGKIFSCKRRTLKTKYFGPFKFRTSRYFWKMSEIILFIVFNSIHFILLLIKIPLFVQKVSEIFYFLMDRVIKAI